MPAKTIAALLLVSQFACGGPLAAPPPEQLAVSQAELRSPHVHRATVGVAASSTQPDFKKRFAVAATPDLFIAFDSRSKAGVSHRARFEINGPSGAIYQATEVPFVQSGGTTRVWTWLPVAGTWIEQYSMTGNWEVKVFVDDAADAAATSTFLLQ